MTSWILRLLSITLATPHRLVACTDLISVFSIFIQVIDHLTLPQSISVSEDEISFLIPTTFPSSWALALILSEFPGSTCLSPAVHAISTLSSPITLLFSYPWNPSFPFISTLKKSHLDLANVLIYFLPFTDKFKCTICTQGFYLLLLILATTWLKHTHQRYQLPPCHQTPLHSSQGLKYQQCGKTRFGASLQHLILLNSSHLLLPEPRSQTHGISCCLIPNPSHSVSLQPCFVVKRLSSKQIHQNHSFQGTLSEQASLHNMHLSQWYSHCLKWLLCSLSGSNFFP